MDKTRRLAIVIGGSMTGMLAAHVLSQHYAQVTLIDRDVFSEAVEIRDGVPQARHLHVLLAKGLDLMEQFFPGIGQEMVENGATTQQWGSESTVYMERGWMPSFESSIITHGISRTLLEWLVRKRIQANPTIRILERTVVKHLATSPDKKQVTGVEIQRRGEDTSSTLSADLVVDASGRTSNTPKWLVELGYETVSETVINSFLGYASRWYKRPSAFPSGKKMLTVQSLPPHYLTGGVIMEVENGTCIVTLAGVNKQYPPTDEAGFLAFAHDLLSPAIYDIIKDAEPLSKVYGYQRTENRVRHYERFQRWPEGYMVMGDAACAFNPIYGQGMTTGALEAAALDELLNDYTHRSQSGMAKRFQERLAAVIQTPWLMATSEDMRYPGTIGGKPNWRDRLVQLYLQRVISIMPLYPDIADTFLHVMNLLKPPSVLFHPTILLKIIKSYL